MSYDNIAYHQASQNVVMVPAQIQCGRFNHTLDVGFVIQGAESDSEPLVTLALYLPPAKSRFTRERTALAQQEDVPFDGDAIQAAIILMAVQVGVSLDRIRDRELTRRHLNH